jgi:hypothetical protein
MLSEQEDKNGKSCCNSLVLTFDFCSQELACSADPQRRSALAGLRHLAKQKTAESVKRLCAASPKELLKFLLAHLQDGFSDPGEVQRQQQKEEPEEE